MQQKQPAAKKPDPNAIARAFVDARLRGARLAAYPGEPPLSLQDAYAIQDAAIDLWPDTIAGWKVGRILGADEHKYGVDRLAGPIFKASVKPAANIVDMNVFSDGFVAVEGEVVIILKDDAPANKLDWSAVDAAALIEKIVAGVEIASSPYPGINESGPLVTISDFGNNFGLIVGGEIPDWRAFHYADWQCETLIDGQSVGKATPANIPGGPVESLRFLLENSARRGLPLKKRMAVSTGAITGVHEARAGQSATVAFKGVDPIHCRLLGFDPVNPGKLSMRQSA
jgi:2-keto-4-pentenoate hydratase